MNLIKQALISKLAADIRGAYLGAAVPAISQPLFGAIEGHRRGIGAWEGAKSGMKYAPIAMASGALGTGMASNPTNALHWGAGAGTAFGGQVASMNLRNRDIDRKAQAAQQQGPPEMQKESAVNYLKRFMC